MKAVTHDVYGSPDVLHLEEIDLPKVKEDEVLVKVKAAGVNWADWSAVSGFPMVMRLGYGLRAPRKGLRGSDLAGVVDAVGAKVTGFQIGDEVFGWGPSAFSEFVSVKADHLVIKPARLTFEEAASVPMAGMVALQALRDVGKTQPGDNVLIVGASGGIGSFAVQIAKSLGAEVTGVCSTDNVELVRSLGADRVIDYKQEDFTQLVDHFDVIFDIADTASLKERRQLLTDRGVLIPNSGHGGRWIGSIGRIFKAWIISPFVRHTLRPFLSISKRQDLLTVADLIEKGALRPVLDRTYPLAETGTAVAYVGEGHARGKRVLTA